MDETTMTEGLIERLERLYSALGQVDTPGLRELTVEVSHIGTAEAVGVDFRGGKTEAEILNLAYEAIYHVAHLVDHLRRWAKSRSLDPNVVSEHVSKSRALQIIIDLSDRDKHGGPRRDGGLSRLLPELKGVDCALEMRGRDTWVETDLRSATGRAKGPIVITGQVVGGDGRLVGHLTSSYVTPLETGNG